MSDLESKNTQKRSTLGLKGHKLSISSKGGPSLGLKSKHMHLDREASSSKSGTVVVVTKARSKSIASHDAQDDGLTDYERQTRMAALHKAAEEKLHSNVASAEELVSEEQNADLSSDVEEDQNAVLHTEGSEVASEEGSVSSSQKGAEKVIEKHGRTTTAVESVFINSGKIRNLDHFGRKKQSKESGGDSQAAINDTTKSRLASVAKDVVKSADGESVREINQDGYHAKHSGDKKKFLVDDEREVVVNRKKELYNEQKKKKLSIEQIMQLDDESEVETVLSKPRGIRSIRRMQNQGAVQRKVTREKISKAVKVSDTISVEELALRASEKTATIIKALMGLGVMANKNQSIDFETAELVLVELGHTIQRDVSQDVEENIVESIKADDADVKLKLRSPIVTIMGHVDHGKTSLLDAYRQSRVVEGEAGGITQHIGAYQVECKGNKITFLDTPGHAAFTAMRLRGAMATDIVILIVAADDGVMEQTIEAISHAKAAGVPIIVAINKIDKPQADAAKVRTQLLSYDLIPEDMGGDTMVVEISAKTGINLDTLLESILLQAEVLELKAPYDRSAVGVVVESRLEKGQGIVTTVLVKKGTLKKGDIMVVGSTYGRIRTIYNDMGTAIAAVLPSMPAEVIGLENSPIAGDEFIVVSDEKTARDIVEFRIEQQKHANAETSIRKQVSLEEMFSSVTDSKKTLNVIVKADVHGSAEAIVSSLNKIESDAVEVNVVHQGVGGISESDVTLAQASHAIVVGFNVRATGQAVELAKVSGVDIRYYSIIYELLDEIKAAASGLLAPIRREVVTGTAEVREVFDLTKYGKVAGCYVLDGVIKRSAYARVIRDNVVIYQGELKALKRFKEDVKEVKAGQECGISFEKYSDLKAKDKIEACYIIEEQQHL